MKAIKPTNSAHHWPRHKANSVECRDRDLVLRITDWLDDQDEPAYDVECYIGGVYDWNESESFTLHELKDKRLAKAKAIEFAKKQIQKLL